MIGFKGNFHHTKLPVNEFYLCMVRKKPKKNLHGNVYTSTSTMIIIILESYIPAHASLFKVLKAFKQRETLFKTGLKFLPPQLSIVIL